MFLNVMKNSQHYLHNMVERKISITIEIGDNLAQVLNSMPSSDIREVLKSMKVNIQEETIIKK